nr:MAG TPA: hypothetical protein [Caudoviricetes sp.]
MDKIECYNCAMLAVMKADGLEDIEKLEILDVLMEARNMERATVAAWKTYEMDKEAQQG